MVRGLAQWRKELTAYAVQMERDAGSADDEVSEARAAGMLSDAGTARGALLFVENLAKDVQPPRPSTSPGGAKWGEFCRWADGLLGKYLRRNLSEDESAAKERIDRILQELPAADSLDSEATLMAFRQVIEDSLQSPMGHIGVTGEGVFVAPFSAATGMSFDAVWMVGMIEGSVPPPIGMDPLLPEKEWEEAGGAARPGQAQGPGTIRLPVSHGNRAAPQPFFPGVRPVAAATRIPCAVAAGTGIGAGG